MLGFIHRAYRAVIDFLIARWEHLKNSNASFSSLGDKLISSAQEDLLNLKGKLDKLWEIQEQDKKTAALYFSAVLGKFGFTFIIIGVSLVTSLIKLAFGSICLLLAGKCFSLISKIFNIGCEIISYSLTFIGDFFKNLFTNALKLISKAWQKFADYASKFINATLDFVRAVTSSLSAAWKFVLDCVSAVCRNIVSAAKWIGNIMLDAWKVVLDFVAAACRAIKSFVINFVQNIGNAIINCIKGVGHLIIGTLKASTIIIKGALLSIAALFIETGVANSLSGVAKTMFILEEALAAGIGALMDGIYASGNSFLKAVKSIFGYGKTVSATGSLDSSFDTETASEPCGSTYYSKKARANAHYVNECFASAGNGLLNVYQKQKEQMIGASGWSADAVPVTHSRAVRSSPTRMVSI